MPPLDDQFSSFQGGTSAKPNFDDEMEMDANDKGESGRCLPKEQHSQVNVDELKILEAEMGHGQKPTPPPRAGDKQGSSQLDGSESSNSSGEDLDTMGSMGSKKVLMPTKMVPNPSQWKADDIDFVCQYQYKTDVGLLLKLLDKQHWQKGPSNDQHEGSQCIHRGSQGNAQNGHPKECLQCRHL